MTNQKAIEILMWVFYKFRIINNDEHYDEPPTEEEMKKAGELAIDALEQCSITGYWYIDERPESNRETVCSNCEQPLFKFHKLDFDWRPKYCPNCGAKMS